MSSFTLARQSIQRIARERALVDPEREVCGECRGSGRGDYGPCPDCDGYGSWPASDLHERPAHEAECLAWADFFSSAAPSGEASVNPSPAGASFPSKRKAA